MKHKDFRILFFIFCVMLMICTIALCIKTIHKSNSLNNYCSKLKYDGALLNRYPPVCFKNILFNNRTGEYDKEYIIIPEEVTKW